MIKKSLITKMYQINLYCDKCGSRMKRAKDFVLMSEPPQFRYECECGHTEISTITYPLQQIFFDEENAEEIEESEVQNG